MNTAFWNKNKIIAVEAKKNYIDSNASKWVPTI